MAQVRHIVGNAIKLGATSPTTTALFLCDMQEKFRPNINHFSSIVETSSRVLRAARILDMTVVLTEQYPKGLGRTVPELGTDQYDNLQPIAKTQFSMCVPEVMKLLEQKSDISSVLLCGIETHACIQHTARDLLALGYQVHVVADACSSRSPVDRKFALKCMRQMGAFLTTSEAAILGLAPDAAHPSFRQLQSIVRQSAPDTGLMD